MIVAALPRSPLHLALLEANGSSPTHVLYREEWMREGVERLYPGKGIYLGREGRLPRRPLAAMRQFAANRVYYRQIRATLEPLGIERLILFLEGEPLERSIMDWFGGEMELWEDGLSHYIDLTSPTWYALRGAVQIASGFYPRGAMARRVDRSRFVVRDRFESGGLALPIPQRAEPEDLVCIIGSPLVEDGLIGRDRLRKGLAAIGAASPWPIRYLPHPREDMAALEAMLATIPGAALAPQPFGIMVHAQIHGYRAFIAPISTALLDLGAFGDSLFVPGIFGARRMHDALAGWAHNPVRVAGKIEGVRAFFRQ